MSLLPSFALMAPQRRTASTPLRVTTPLKFIVNVPGIDVTLSGVEAVRRCGAISAKPVASLLAVNLIANHSGVVYAPAGQ